VKYYIPLSVQFIIKQVLIHDQATRGGGTDAHGTPYASTLSEFKRTDHEDILKDRESEAAAPVSTMGKVWNQYVAGRSTKGLDPDNATSVSYSQRKDGTSRPE
jgi:hypothetical protein